VIELIIIDPALEIRLPESLDRTIASPADYVEGYHHIANSIHTGKNLRVLVTNRRVSRWLKVMAEKYGYEYVVVEELTPRHVFQDQTGIMDLPEEVTDSRLLDSGLLDLQIPAAPGASFDDYLLRVFFGDFLTLPNGLRRISDIITGYDPQQWAEALERPLVREIFQRRIRLLRDELQSQGQVAELQLLDWIDVSPQVLIRSLFALKVLTSYPEELGYRVFGSIYRDLKRSNLDLRRVPPVLRGNEQTLNEINLYLERVLATPGEWELDSLLEHVSGCLEIEFDAIERLLALGAFEVSRDPVRRIQAKFTSLQSSPRIAQALADLDLLITRNPPSPPDPSWDADSWIQWATQDYLPYRYWLENTGRLDDQIGEIANTYAEWLYRNYGQLLYHSDRMVWKALLNLREEMKEHSGPVLVVVIDNFNTKFYSDLRIPMQHQGFYEHHVHYCFSLLPSCTEVSKRALMTGHYAPFPETAYQNQVEGAWSGRLGKRIKYLGSIGELRRISEHQHDIYFLNYLPLDMTLHQNESQTGVSHAQAVRNYLSLLAQDVSAFSRRIGAERDLMVVVVSDHGSTRIPRGTVNVIQKKYYQERAQDRHHRYIAISDHELERLPKNVKFDCFVFRRDSFELSTNYLVARRLYRFLPTDDDAYIHGGLTPEETLVPLAIYRPATISPKPLTVILLDSAPIYTGTKVDLRLEITNINNYPCRRLAIEFDDPNIEAERRMIPEIPRLDRVTVEIPGRCPRTADASARRLKACLSFDFLGQPWEYEIGIPVVIVEPAKAKFDLDNL